MNRAQDSKGEGEGNEGGKNMRNVLPVDKSSEGAKKVLSGSEAIRGQRESEEANTIATSTTTTTTTTTEAASTGSAASTKSGAIEDLSQEELYDIGAVPVSDYIYYCSSRVAKEFLPFDDKDGRRFFRIRKDFKDTIYSMDIRGVTFVIVTIPDATQFDLRAKNKGSMQNWFKKVKSFLEKCACFEKIVFTTFLRSGNKDNGSNRGLFLASLLAAQRGTLYGKTQSLFASPPLENLRKERRHWFYDGAQDILESIQCAGSGSSSIAGTVSGSKRKATESTEDKAPKERRVDKDGARQEVQEVQEAQEEQDARQAAEQGAEQGAELGMKVDDMDMDDMDMELETITLIPQDLAALKIQKWYRCIIARKTVKSLKEERSRAERENEDGAKQGAMLNVVDDKPDYVTLASFQNGKGNIINKKKVYVRKDAQPFMLQVLKKRKKYQLFEEPNGKYKSSKYFKPIARPTLKSLNQLKKWFDSQEDYVDAKNEPHEFLTMPGDLFQEY